MTQNTTRSGLTVPGVTALVLAVGAVLALWVHNMLWTQNAGDPIALDAGEGAATIAWFVGWMLVIGASVASVVLLMVVIRRIIARTMPLIDVIALVLAAALIVFAVILAPLWGAGSA